MKIFDFIDFLDNKKKFTQSDFLTLKVIRASSNPLSVLNLDSYASMEDVKNQYRKLSLEFHPDINPGYEDKMVEINLAYDLIKSNPEMYLRENKPKRKQPPLKVEKINYRDLPQLFLSRKWDRARELTLIMTDKSEGYLTKYSNDEEYEIEWSYDGNSQIIPVSQKEEWNKKFEYFNAQISH